MLCLVSLSCLGAKTKGLLSDYGDTLGRTRAHAGVDFAAPQGSNVLAAADGEVTTVATSAKEGGCGTGVTIYHPAAVRYTVYCHLGTVLVSSGEHVTRGQVIATVGPGPNGVPHVHLEVCRDLCWFGHEDGDLEDTIDPMVFLDGCFTPGMNHPVDELELTYPVPCTVADKQRRPDPAMVWMERQLIVADRTLRAGDRAAALLSYEDLIKTMPLIAPRAVYEKVALLRFRELRNLGYGRTLFSCDALVFSDEVMERVRARDGSRLVGAISFTYYFLRRGDAVRARRWLEMYLGTSSVGSRPHDDAWRGCLKELAGREDTLACADGVVVAGPRLCNSTMEHDD
jgi:hypothetical protein